MNLRDYWRIARRRAWIPILLVVVSLVSATVLTVLSKPEYTATATVLARTSGTLQFSDVATSNSVGLRVMHDLNLGGSVDSVTNRVRVTAGRSNTYRIAASDPNPEKASALANTTAREAASLYQELQGGSASVDLNQLEQERNDYLTRYLAAATALLTFNRQHPDAVGTDARPKDVTVGAKAMQLQVAERAANDAYLSFEAQVTRSEVDALTSTRNYAATIVDQAAAIPDTSGRILRVVYAVLLALAAGFVIVFALEYVDHAVRLPEEAEELLNAPVVGIIPRGSPRTLRAAKGVGA